MYGIVQVYVQVYIIIKLKDTKILLEMDELIII